jgi:hypothetical protein
MLETVKAFFRRPVRLDRALGVILIVVVAFVLLSSRSAFRAANARASSPDIGVAELIKKLKNELEKMEEERLSQGEDAILRLKDVDLELSFVVKVDQNNKNELHFEAVTVGTDQGLSLERADKITLHMEIEPPKWISVEPSKTHLPLDGTTVLPLVPLKRSNK